MCVVLLNSLLMRGSTCNPTSDGSEAQLKSIRVHLPTEVVAVEYAYVVARHTFT